jgi:hypothetical protein
MAGMPEGSSPTLEYQRPAAPRWWRRWLPVLVAVAVGLLYPFVLGGVWAVTGDPPGKLSPAWQGAAHVLEFPALGTWGATLTEAIARLAVNLLFWGGGAGGVCWLAERARRRASARNGAAG